MTPRATEAVAMLTVTDQRLAQALAELGDVQLRLDGETLRRQDSEALFDRVFSAMSDAVLLVDPRGEVSRANDAAARLTARDTDSLVGLRPRDIFGAEVPATPWEIFRRAPAGTLESLDTNIERPDGGELAVSVSCAVVKDAHDKVIGALYAARDVTERARADQHRGAQLAVTRVLADSRSVAQALPRLLEALGECLCFESAAAWMADEEGAGLVCRHAWQGAPAAAAGERSTVGWDEGLVGDVWGSGRAAADPELRSACVPISTGTEVVGVLEFRCGEGSACDEPLLDVLTTIGAQIGQFLERRRAEEALNKVELFKSAFERAPVGMALFGVSGESRGRVLQVNDALRDFLGRPDNELIGQEAQALVHPEDLESLLASIERVLRGESETAVLETRHPHRDGHVVWGIVHLSILKDELGEPLYGIVQVQDITERKRAEDQLAHQALHDPLTALPNRSLFLDRLGHALARSRRLESSKLAVMFLDIDHFKVVNDSLGHGAGDELLMATAARIASVLRPADTVARFGGDEFTVLCEDMESQEEAIGIAERIASATAAPFMVQGREVFLTLSIGIAPSSGGRDGAEALLRDADAAMYWAKAGGRNRHAVFNKAMRVRALKRLELEDALRRAIAQGEMQLAYQPEISLETGRVVGCEALVRWHDPDRGVILPGEFIPMAEETGLIVALGEFVIMEACRQAKRWRELDGELGDLKVSVNISPRQLADPELVDVVRGALADTGTKAENLWLEITESMVMEDEGSSLEMLELLKGLGVGFAIDDFGMGFSSLSRLRELPPVEAVKLDRSFIARLCTGSSDKAIVAAGINLARALDATAVAEGVETAEQVAELRELGCDYAQGYYFARPAPAEELTELLLAGAVG